MRISPGICTEVPPESNLQGVTQGHHRNHQKTVQGDESRDHRGRGMPRPSAPFSEYMSIAQFVGTLKSKSTLMIFDRHANLKYKYGSRNFWCRGYFADTVGKNAKMIQEYIQNQLEEDLASD